MTTSDAENRKRVALRKESVDRNLSMGLDGRFKLVALRKESVDRNSFNPLEALIILASLSARRAWIEICCSRWMLAS